LLAFNVAEWLSISFVATLAIISPGPSFTIALRNTLAKGRQSGLLTALGIATGDLLHALFSLFGLSVIIAQSPWVFTIVKIVGSIYLIYIGILGVLAKPTHIVTDLQGSPINNNKSDFLKGFLVVLLNPKAWVFFVCLSSVIVSSKTLLGVRLFYSLWLSLISATWFSTVAYVFSHQHVRAKLMPYLHWIERLMGVVLIYIGLHVMFFFTLVECKL
jgi:threonine/homoserine/homoserine lactone efflux protein